MVSGIEATADIVTGGLLAHAAEPEPHGGGAHVHAEHPAACLNCGTQLIGEHCHRCGQSAHVHRTMGAIGHDLAHGVFHFEGKAWDTLPMLLLHPGSLTRRYVAGQRARFVSPIALFLFSVFLMFAIVANLPLWHVGDGSIFKGDPASTMARMRVQIGEERRKAQEQVAGYARELRQERADATPDVERIARLERRLADSRQSIAKLANAERVFPADATSSVATAPPSVPSSWLNAKWRQATENPKLLLYKLKTSAYKFSWALIPLSVPFLWLLFPFSRRFGLYDHAVFVTYSLTFMSLLTVAVAVLLAIGVPSLLPVLAASVIAPLHVYKQLKGAYSLGRVSALARTALLLGFVVWAILPMFVLGLLYLGLAD